MEMQRAHCCDEKTVILKSEFTNSLTKFHGIQIQHIHEFDFENS